MKIIEKILAKYGYVKIEKYNEIRPSLELIQKHEVRIIRGSFVEHASDYLGMREPEFTMKMKMENMIHKVLKEAAPFVEHRIQRDYSLRTHFQDAIIHEFRLRVLAPKK